MITPLNDDLNIIAALDDEPNDEGGLTPVAFKAKFDEGPNAIKNYINNTMISNIGTDITAAVSAAQIQSGNMPAGGTAGQTLIKNSDSNYDYGWSSAMAPKTYVDSAIAAIPAPTLLYEKIRNITNASGTGSVSVDVSDINWTTYAKIMLKGQIKLSTAGQWGVRLNSISSGYCISGIASDYSGTNSSTTYPYLFSVTYANTADMSYAEIEIVKNGAAIGGKSFTQSTYTNTANGRTSECVGHYPTGISTLSAINLISVDSASYTIYLQNASLWGVKR